MRKEELKTYIENHESEMIEDLKSLIRIPSEKLQRPRQVGASHRCIGPDSTLCIVRIHFYITLNAGKCQ